MNYIVKKARKWNVNIHLKMTNKKSVVLRLITVLFAGVTTVLIFAIYSNKNCATLDTY